VDVVEGQSWAHGPLGFWFQGLRPKAGNSYRSALGGGQSKLS
jgi:hypothetical protein